jgi:hypothetical protein
MAASTATAAPARNARVPTRRTTELLLVVLAVLIAAFGYADTGYAIDGRIPADTGVHSIGLGVLALVAHLAVRLRARHADPLLLPLAVLLNGVGLVAVYRLDRATATSSAPSRLVWSAPGVALFTAVVLLLRDYRVLRRYGYLPAFCAIVLMIVPVFLPCTSPPGGPAGSRSASSWSPSRSAACSAPASAGGTPT